MVTYDNAIGKRITDARNTLNLSQRALANLAGISQPTIHRIETGEREASTTELKVIADALGVLTSDLLGTNRLSEDVSCAGRTNDEGAQVVKDYMIYALGLAQHMDDLGVPSQA
ncbi:MAG: helix-turn-helix transcriptional regulator [Acidobacteriota bacterium]|nr:helix-turn-helix transcriptional regulator [Acidobacteriota bacterium]